MGAERSAGGRAAFGPTGASQGSEGAEVYEAALVMYIHSRWTLSMLRDSSVPRLSLSGERLSLLTRRRDHCEGNTSLRRFRRAR